MDKSKMTSVDRAIRRTRSISFQNFETQDFYTELTQIHMFQMGLFFYSFLSNPDQFMSGLRLAAPRRSPRRTSFVWCWWSAPVHPVSGSLDTCRLTHCSQAQRFAAERRRRGRWQSPGSAPPATTIRHPPCSSSSTDCTATCRSSPKPHEERGGRDCRWPQLPAAGPSRRPRTPSSSSLPTPGPSCSSTVPTTHPRPCSLSSRVFGNLLICQLPCSVCAGVCNLCNGGVRFVREHDPNRYSHPAQFSVTAHSWVCYSSVDQQQRFSL
jgi:hypothetical protein